AQGIDYNKLHLLLAVLGRHGFNFYQKDVYVNVAGGARVEEPACDLAIACAIASSTRNIPLRLQTVFLGEIGLTGEIRPVGFVEQRLREARKLGFKRCIGPFLEKGEAKKIREIEFVGVRTLTEALREGFKK
ncbi:DNA repair protein RadA, partial [Candidatus Aerophobetes bacterium]|nr:DNA repair protein RadA [Candidatus Aerophobetes bacterium]